MSQQITWCGWTFNFAQETVHLTAEKLNKLRMQLHSLTRSKKLLPQTPRAMHRPAHVGNQHMQTPSPILSTALQGPAQRQRHPETGPSQWQHFLDALGPDATVHRQPLGLWLPMHARITDVGSTQIHSKADIPRVPTAHKATWVRIADPSRTEIHLRDESRQAITWLSCWIITASQCAWFSETWSMQQMRTVWPQLQEDAQKIHSML